MIFYTSTEYIYRTEPTRFPPARDRVACHSSSFAAPSPSAFLAFLLFFFFFFSPVEGGAAAGSLPLSSSCFLQLSGHCFFMKAAFDLHSPALAHELQLKFLSIGDSGYFFPRKS